MDRAQEAIPNDLTPLGEASVLACLRVTGPSSGFTLAVLNLYAQALSRLVTIYVCSENGNQIRTLAYGDLKGGKFRDGGREVTFADGRAKIIRLAVRLAELHPAIEALKRNAPPSEE
jgi:hypothetical protein